MAIPNTVWVPQPQSTEGEYDLITAVFIVDENGNNLVDPVDSTIDIISTDSSFTGVSGTVWVVDDTNE